QRPLARDGPDRHRKDDDTLRLPATSQHRLAKDQYDRGPDRVWHHWRAAVASQSQARRRFSGPPEEYSPPGPRCDYDRRGPRRSDGGNGGSRRPKVATPPCKPSPPPPPRRTSPPR